MTDHCDVLVSGTGGFAARIVFDIAATAAEPVQVVVAGRNRQRLDWLVTAANARAAIFGGPARFRGHAIDLLEASAPDRLIGGTAPRVVVQAASVQTSSVIATTGDAWSALVRDGGLSATAVAQALISSRVAAAITRSGRDTAFINCSFPDVVNAIIVAMGHAVVSGMGNVAILSTVFAGARGLPHERIRVLAHYQNLAAFRRVAAERGGPAPRVWIDGAEVMDVFGAFADVKLTPEPVIDVSGASGVPLILALASGGGWRGHAPGPNGLPGGYPVRLAHGRMELDLPAGLGAAEAIAWNTSYEARNGLVVGEDGQARYTGRLRDLLHAHSPELAAGFAVTDLEEVYTAMRALRDRLERAPEPA
jgi:hypothetical protein